MDLTTQRRCLGAIAGGLLIGAAGVIGWSLSGIDESNVIGDPARGQHDRPTIPSVMKTQRFDDRVAAKALRGPLYDPPSQPTPRVERPKPPASAPASSKRTSLDLTLVGTIIEADKSFAILADASGNFDVKGIGESLELTPEGITLQNIESEQVTVQYQGRQSTVQLDRSRKKFNNDSGGGGKRRSNRRRNQ